MAETTLTFTGHDHVRVREHLYPGDGCEAAAVLICTRTLGPRLRLLVQEVLLVPHAECSRREPDRLTWPGRWLAKAVEVGEEDERTLILIHSHPGGLFSFSSADDHSDQVVLPTLFADYGDLHGTAIMTPDGAVKARLYTPDMNRRTVDLVSVIGDDLQFWDGNARWDAPRHRPMAFGEMAPELGRLRAAIIGVSGTGSIVAEQVARLGFGQTILIDFDQMEAKNLNRILNSTLDDARTNRPKVDMMAAAIASYRGPGVAVPVAASIASREGILAASQADVMFCCVDTLEARMIADRIAAAFLIPLFDVGVVIPVMQRPEGMRIAEVAGRIDYVKPGGSTLADRGLYTPESLAAEELRLNNPEEYDRRLKEGYIRGAAVEAPSVIALNTIAAGECVLEFIARAYPFRHDENRLCARTKFTLAAREREQWADSDFAITPNPIVGQGAAEPLLGMPKFGPPKKKHP
ncbi:ThiF family adenylyltransferase [Lacibacterium aquatile]